MLEETFIGSIFMPNSAKLSTLGADNAYYYYYYYSLLQYHQKWRFSKGPIVILKLVFSHNHLACNVL